MSALEKIWGLSEDSDRGILIGIVFSAKFAGVAVEREWNFSDLLVSVPQVDVQAIGAIQ